MSKLKLQNNKGEIATTLTVLSLFVMIAGVFVGGFNKKPNTIQNRADAGSCIYNTTAIVMKARPGGGRMTFTQDENGGKVMSIKNDKQSQSFNLSSSNSSYVSNIPNYAFGGSNPYLPGDKATVTLSGLDEKWRVKEVFCNPQNSGAKGCDLNPSATGDKKLSIKDFHVVCGVDIQYGWVVELVPTITPTPTSLVVRPTSGTVQPIPTNSRLPILPTGSRFPGDPTPTPVTDNEPPVSRTVSGTVNLKGPKPSGAQTLTVQVNTLAGALLKQQSLTIPSTYHPIYGVTLQYRMDVVVPTSGVNVVLMPGFNNGAITAPNNTQYTVTQCPSAKTSNKCGMSSQSSLTANFSIIVAPDQVGQPPVVKTKTIKGKISWTGNLPLNKNFHIYYNCTVNADKSLNCSERKYVLPDVKTNSVTYSIPNANVGGDDNRFEIALAGFHNGNFPAGTTTTALGCAKQGKTPSECIIENVNNMSGDLTQDFQVNFPAAGQCNFAAITQITDVHGNALPDFAQSNLWSYSNNKGGTDKFDNMFRSSYTSEKILSASDDYVISDGKEGGVDYKRGDQLFWTLKYDPIQYKLLGNNIRVCDYNADKDSVTGTNCQDNTRTSGDLLSTAPGVVDCNKKIIGGWWFEKLPPTPTIAPIGNLQVQVVLYEDEKHLSDPSKGKYKREFYPNNGFELQLEHQGGEIAPIILKNPARVSGEGNIGAYRYVERIPAGKYDITVLEPGGDSSYSYVDAIGGREATVYNNQTTTIVHSLQLDYQNYDITTDNNCPAGSFKIGNTKFCATKKGSKSVDSGGAGCWCTNENQCKAADGGKGDWKGDKGYCDQSNGKSGDGLCCVRGASPSCEQRGLGKDCKGGTPGGGAITCPKGDGNQAGQPGCSSTNKCDRGGGCNNNCGARGERRDGKVFDVPNGYCRSGYSGRDENQTRYQTCVNNACVYQVCPAGQTCASDCSACGGTGGTPSGAPRRGVTPPPPAGGNTQACLDAGGGCTYRGDCLSQEGGQIVAQGSCSSLGAGNICCKLPRVTPPPVGGNTTACNAAGGGCTVRSDCTSVGGRIVASGSCSSLGSRNVCCVVDGATPPPVRDNTAACSAAGGGCTARQDCVSAGGDILSGKGCVNTVCCKIDGVTPPPPADTTVTGPDCPTSGRQCSLDDSGGKQKCKLTLGSTVKQGYCCPDAKPDWDGSRCVAKPNGAVPAYPNCTGDFIKDNIDRVCVNKNTLPICSITQSCNGDTGDVKPVGHTGRCFPANVTSGANVEYCCPVEHTINRDRTKCEGTSTPPPAGDLSCLDKYPGVQAKLNAALEEASNKCNIIPNIDLGKITWDCFVHFKSGSDNDTYDCKIGSEGAFDWNPGACINAIEVVSAIIANDIYDPVCRAAVFASKAIAGCTNDGVGAVRTSYDELNSALNNKVKNTVLWGDVDVTVKDACLNPPTKICSGCGVTEYSTRYAACASTATALKDKLPSIWNAMKSAASSCGARFGGWSANIGIENGSDLPITQVTVSMCDENGVCQDRVQDVSIQPGQKSNVQTSVTQMVSDQQLNDKYTLTCKLTYADGSTGDCPSSQTRLNTSVSMKVATDATGEVTGDALSSLEGSDCDGDNVVTTIDYTKMTLVYGQTGDSVQCDTDLSGSVNAIDAANMIRHLNEQVVLPASSSTQQPTQ